MGIMDKLKKKASEETDITKVKTTEEKDALRKNISMSIVLMLVFGVLVIGVAYSIYDTYKSITNIKSDRKKMVEKVLPDNKGVGGDKIEKQWRSIMEDEVNSVKKDMKELRYELDKRDSAMRKEINDISKNMVTASDLNQLRQDILNAKKNDVQVFKKSDLPNNKPIETKNTTVVGNINNDNVSNGGDNNIKTVNTSNNDVRTGEVLLQESNKVAEKTLEKPIKMNRLTFSAENSYGTEREPVQKEDILYIPMGFTTGVAIMGMDAPTFNWGEQDPQPIVISVENDMVTAGNHLIDLRECMVLGSGAGSVSSERALLRLIKMECRDETGNLFRGNVEGWVVGDDGKVGMQGRLVTRYGSVAAKAFMAGILDGIGQILRDSSSELQDTALGLTRTTIKPEDSTKAAVGAGLSSASSKLQDFYIKILEKIYPVIEILPGRRVTVMFKGDSVLQKVKDSDIFDLVSINNESQQQKENKQ
jgi:conjugal transfer pilus assembly protein TraB